MRSDSEVARNHDKGFALANRCADPMWTAEQNQSRIRSAGMTEQLPCQAAARFDEKIQTLLLPVRPRSHHKRMVLQEGPEADRRDPQIDILSSVNSQGFRQADIHLNRTTRLGDLPSRVAVAERAIAIEDPGTLEGAREEEEPDRDIEIEPREELISW